MRIICAEDYMKASQITADIIAQLVCEKPDCVLGLPTGSSPLGTYQELIQMYQHGMLDFSGVHTINLDEYLGLPPEHPQSYHYFMRHNLFDHINIDPAHCNLPDGMNSDVQSECSRYDALIDQYGGADLQFLGLGGNGHIGFNEPADSFSKNTNKASLAQSTIDANARFFEKKEDVPKYAYTMGIGGIMKARKVLMIATGQAKAQAVKECFFGPVKPQVPGSILQFHPDFTLVADEAALELVKNYI